jgi:hypothetical protein
MLEVYVRLGLSSGWVFWDAKGRRERPGHYEPYTIALIQWIQSKGTVEERLLPRDEDVRGYNTHSTNFGIADMDIKRLVR